MARAEQVRVFRRALDSARSGDPGVLLIGGDAGVGKTRLVTHLDQVARETGARVVTAHCVDLGEVGIPYLPFTEALGTLREVPAVAQVVEERPALARLLDPAGGAAGADHAERLQLFDGIAASLAAAGDPDAPLVLVMEDAHWADASTRDVLRFVVARLRSEHLMLVVTYRSDDVDRRHPLRPVLAELHRQRTVEHLELAPFTRDELRQFAAAVKDGDALSERELDEVLRRSEGNAFFAEELLDAGLPSAGLPWSLAEVLQTRLAHLDPQVQQLVRLAAVAGRQVDEELLRATAARLPELAGAGAVEAALREAVARQVLGVEGQKVAFRHALVAEALALELLPGERNTMHRAYLDALTDDDTLGSAAQRAHHALAGHVAPVALVASYEAAREAAEVLAPTEVLRHLEQVLTLWDSVPEALSLVARMGRFGDDAEGVGRADVVFVLLAASRAASDSGQPARAVQLAQRAVEAARDDPARQARLRYLLARFLLDVEREQEAGRECDLALDVLPADPPSRELAWTLAVRARVALNRDEDELARDLAERAAVTARAADAPGPEADALVTLAVLEVGEPAEAARLLEAARGRAQDAGALHTELRCWFNLASTHYYAGDIESARQVLDDGLARSRELGVPWTSYSLEMWMMTAIIPYLRGDLTDHPVPRGVPALSLPLLEAARLYAAVARGDADVVDRAEALREHWCDDGQIALLAGGLHADALTAAGRHEDAVDAAEEVAAYLGETWSEFFLGRIWITALALAALADGAEMRPTPPAATGALLDRGETLLAVAHETAQRGRPRGGRLGPEGRAWLQRAAAEHARLRAAVTGEPADPAVWEATVREFSFGYRYEVARSRFRWAQALRAAGDPTAAELQAVEVAAEAEAMAATPLAEAVQAWARRARIALPGSRRTTTVLTEREEEVLTLVAQGLSNRQIGEKLYISTKTVSVHVSNVIAKLGVTGRTEAVTVAHRRGLLKV